MGSYTAQANMTNTTSWEIREEQSTGDVMINMLLLFTTILVVAFVCYIIRYLLRDDPSPEEKAAVELSEHEKRAVFIQDNLLVREWTDDDEVEDDAEGDNETATKEKLIIQCSGMDELAGQVRKDVSKDDNGDKNACSTASLDSAFEGCAICLADYKRYQRICESSNPSCKHIFHEECMVNWLMKHDQCPICQQLYIA